MRLIDNLYASCESENNQLYAITRLLVGRDVLGKKQITKAVLLLFVLVFSMVCRAEPCNDEQLRAMEAAGMSEAQIHAACQVSSSVSSSDVSWLSGEWYVWQSYTKSLAIDVVGMDVPRFNVWVLDVSDGALTISIKNPFGYITHQETVATRVTGNKMEFNFRGVEYVLDLKKGNRVLGDFFYSVPGVYGTPWMGGYDMEGKIDMTRYQ